MVLTGGSAFGLAERRRRRPVLRGAGAWGSRPSAGRCRSSWRWACSTSGRLGDDAVPTRADDGYAACVAATRRARSRRAWSAPAPARRSASGAAAEHARAAGLGAAAERHGDLVVAALRGRQRVRRRRRRRRCPRLAPGPSGDAAFGNTTIGVDRHQRAAGQGRVPRRRARRPRRPRPGASRRRTPASTAMRSWPPRRAMVEAPTSTSSGSWRSIAVERAAREGAVAVQTRLVLSMPTALEVLAAEVGTCTRCPLSEGRTQVVFGVGDPQR